MSKPIDITKLFKEVTQSPRFKNYFLLGGLLHLAMCVTTIIELFYPINPETLNIKYHLISGSALFLSTITSLWFLGFWINTIKENYKKETNEQFEIANLNAKKNILSGLIFFFVMLLPQMLLILISILIGIISLIVITISIAIIFSPAATEPGTPLPFICGFIAMVITCLVPVLATILFIIIYPQIVSNYLNTSIISTCNLKQIFLQIKNNFKTSFKVSTMTIILGILSMIPFFGFYFELVWAKMFVEYVKLSKKETVNQ